MSEIRLIPHRVILSARAPLFLICACLVLSSCGLFSTSPDESSEEAQAVARGEDTPQLERKKPRTTVVDVEKLNSKKKEKAIEILWEIPQEPVDGFIVRYGPSVTELAHETKIGLNEVERYEHEKFGYVYRYYLQDLNPEKPVFVSITAVRGDTESTPSEVLKVEGGGRSAASVP